MRKSTKYTKELLEPIVKESFSFAQVIKKLGIKWSGGQQQNIKKWIVYHQLDTSHFLGQKTNSGSDHVGGPKKKEWKELLVKGGSKRRIRAVRLRRALIESGRTYQCECCKILPLWNNKKLVLQVNHKNGDWKDNRKENLEFLCPNCHSQTPGWCNSKDMTDIDTDKRYWQNYER
jgi:Zn finger protein HypA/HybF involved in hydrogenase expression